MLTASEWAKRHGMSKQWACDLARDGRIAGAVRHGRTWLVPDDAERPEVMKRGVPASPTGTRALRKLAAAIKREQAEIDGKLSREGVKDAVKLSPRELWWQDEFEDGNTALEGRWVENHGDILGPGWAKDETWEQFHARYKEWQEWDAAGQPDENIPADFDAYCKRVSSGR